MQTFVDVHRWADIKIGNYIVRPQHNHAAEAAGEVVGTLYDDSAFELLANNAEARIAFAEIALEHVLAHAAIQAGPTCFVTITPADCACAVDDHGPGFRQRKARRRRQGPAANFDIVQIQQIARQAMDHIPFIGMVEAALYRRWGPRGRDWKDWVSWHCHLLTWGASQPDLSRHLQPLRRQHRSIREDRPAVHVKAVPADDVGRQFLYALKAPQKLYRVEYFSVPWQHPETGEIRPPGWHTQKDWLQTGQRIRLLDVMGRRRLDRLLFGNAEGTALARAIRAEALTPFRDWERRQPY